MSVHVKKVRLDEFVQNEIKRILGFASKWREVHKGKPETFPLSMDDEGIWYGQFSAFVRSKNPLPVADEEPEEISEAAATITQEAAPPAIEATAEDAA